MEGWGMEGCRVEAGGRGGKHAKLTYRSFAPLPLRSVYRAGSGHLELSCGRAHHSRLAVVVTISPTASSCPAPSCTEGPRAIAALGAPTHVIEQTSPATCPMGVPPLPWQWSPSFAQALATLCLTGRLVLILLWH